MAFSSLRRAKRSNNPTGDLLIRIQNGLIRNFNSILIPTIPNAKELLQLMCDLGYLSGWRVQSNKNDNMLEVFLKYHNGEPAIRGIQQVSTPSKQIWYGQKEIQWLIRDQHNTRTKSLILSTSKGICVHLDISTKANFSGGEPVAWIW